MNTVITITHNQFDSMDGSVNNIREQIIALLDNEELSQTIRDQISQLLADTDQLARQLYTLGEIS